MVETSLIQRHELHIDLSNNISCLSQSNAQSQHNPVGILPSSVSLIFFSKNVGKADKVEWLERKPN